MAAYMIGRVTKNHDASWLGEYLEKIGPLFERHGAKVLCRSLAVEKLEGNLRKVLITVENERAIPSRMAVAERFKLPRPDIATLSGAKVLAAGLVQNQYLNRIELQKKRPERLLVPGIPGFSAQTLYFLVEGGGELNFTYDSLKAGQAKPTVRLPQGRCGLCAPGLA